MGGVRPPAAGAGLLLAVLLAGLLFFPAAAGAVSPEAEAALERARSLYSTHRNVRLAEEEISRAITLEPEYLEAYLLLGEITFETRRYDQVLAITARGLERLPGKLDLLLLRARAFLRQGREEEAERLREQMEELSPRSPQGLWLAALLHSRQEEWEAEAGVIEEALASPSSPPPLLRAGMVRELAAAYERLGRIEEARERFHEYVTMSGDDRGRVRDYLRFLVRHGIGAAHLESYGRGLLEGPSPVPEAFLFLGEGLLLQGRPGEALQTAAVGVARGGPRGGLELLSARAYLALGYRDSALDRAAAAAAAAAPPDEVRQVRRAAGSVEPVTYGGPRLSMEPDSLVAGTVADGARVSFTVILANGGGETLLLRDPWITKVPGRIVDVSLPSREIPPGGRIEAVVTVLGQRGPHELRGEVNLLSNDLMEPRQVLLVEARISAPLRAVFGTEPRGPFLFGEVAWGSEVVREFVVRNTGNVPMRIHEVLTNWRVSWEGLEELEIPPGGEQRMVVRWRVPEREGVVGTHLSFHVEGTAKYVNQLIMQVIVLPSATGEEKK